MLFSIKDRVDLEKLEELALLQNRITVLRLQDKLGEQNFHQDGKKLFKQEADAIKKTSENITKTISENSTKNNKALEKIKKVLELMKDKGMIAPFLTSSVVNLFTPENLSHFRLKKTLIQLIRTFVWRMAVKQLLYIVIC